MNLFLTGSNNTYQQAFAIQIYEIHFLFLFDNIHIIIFTIHKIHTHAPTHSYFQVLLSYKTRNG